MRPFTYQKPATPADAVRAIAGGGAGTRFLAGGTTLLRSHEAQRFERRAPKVIAARCKMLPSMMVPISRSACATHDWAQVAQCSTGPAGRTGTSL